MEWTPKECAYVVFAFVTSVLSAYGAGRIYFMVVSTEWADLTPAIWLLVFLPTLALTITGVDVIRQKRQKIEQERRKAEWEQWPADRLWPPDRRLMR